MRLLTCMMWLALFGSHAAIASAQSAEPPPEYDDLVREALAESAAGRFEEARVLFRRAHAAFPNARTLRGIGMVAFEVRDYADAMRHLSLALDDERRPLTEEQRREAEALLERASAFVGRYDLAAVPEGARILIDGHAAEVESDGTMILRVGPHEVVVRTAAHTWEGRFTVRGGEREPLPIVFDVLPPLAAPHVEEPPRIAPPRAPPDTTTPAIVTAAGVVVAAIGAALVAAGMVDIAAVEGAMNGAPWSSLSGAYERAAPLTGAGVASIVIGGASALLGGVWLGVSTAEGNPQTALGAGLGGRW